MSERSASTVAALEESVGFPLSIDTRWGFREIIEMAFFLVSCWIVIGPLLVLALIFGHAWLLVLGLVAGTATGLYAAILFRRDARLAESALSAVAAEVSEQGLVDACSTEPRLQPNAGPREKLPRRQLKASGLAG